MTDTIPKSEVARVLARALKTVLDPRLLLGDWELGYLSCGERIVADLKIRPEFESALAALQAKEAK